ncbi:hypothetical protein N9948_01700 [bacterium]|nr:hypothetical protein [bacterium]
MNRISKAKFVIAELLNLLEITPEMISACSKGVLVTADNTKMVGITSSQLIEELGLEYEKVTEGYSHQDGQLLWSNDKVNKYKKFQDEENSLSFITED